MNDFSDVSLDPQRPRVAQAKTLQFALTMLGACIVLSLGIGVLLRDAGPPARSGAPARVNMAVPPRSAAKAANVLQYRADASGHYFVDASVNGTTIRFLVDTGASVVALSRDDARAAGIADGGLQFSEIMSTANGQARAARASLRSVRLEQLEVLDVPAVVMDQPMPVSLLGMSFLNKLEGYSIRDGILTMEW
jgi:aspartyl protease family protein